jgi:vacuolar-type H+-ATPase subunit D/Vma8
MDDKTKKRVKAIFTSWQTLLQERAELNAQIRDLIGEASALTEKKTVEVRKTFNFLKKLSDEGNNELEAIIMLTNEITE